MEKNKIKVKDLTKIYYFYDRPIHRLIELITFKKKLYRHPFFALNKVTFDVYEGETLGIIGENGAGKSTLLKLISRTVAPSYGTIEMNGTVSALLELGVGFHPDFTGRSNIYLAASMLGFDKKTIDEKINDIISFSELEDFIDRPVKTYSSGMYLRLAFSVAVSVDPDILVVDEVLAVGDQHFQKKCLDRMIGFKKEKKTILFCSHSLYHIREICDRVLWLKQGKIMAIGDPKTVIREYTDYEREKNSKKSKQETKIYIEKNSFLDSVSAWILNIEKEEKKEIVVKIKVKNQNNGRRFHLGVGIYRNDLVECFATSTKLDGVEPFFVDGEKDIFIYFDSPLLLEGRYKVAVVLFDETGLHVYDRKDQEGEIEIESCEFTGRGLFFMEHRWKV
ncbi:MAG: ABC transporter ATP-binding protein [Deltaproteobacteria bacterium]|nr:ABC transporter ATP-binding protein [Deltaproteobacteria bacterium]RLA91857.1 MAG: ABC transporter ATP-binding protein [Deltaproteobacteria bacterium]